MLSKKIFIPLFFNPITPKEVLYRRLFTSFAFTILKNFFLFVFFLYPVFSAAQTARLSGTIRDAGGQRLPLATILMLPDSAIVPADIEGNFSLKLRKGPKEMVVTYTGYEPFRQSFRLTNDTTIRVALTPRIGQLEEVLVVGDRYSQEALVQSARTGTTTITRKDITTIPVFGGEADVIKTLQLLPGTTRGVEGSSDLFVRGGAADQNLVLLDGAPIYNTSHLFGFLSVFNTDILEKVEAINGGFPAEYGGRLSSILDITSRDRLAEKTSVSGEVGLIASRLFVEQPLLKDKASFWLAGRRTYIDKVVQVIGEELPYFFYDLNGKLIVKPSPNDQLEISFYNGEDVLDVYQDSNNNGSGFVSSNSSKNSSQSIQWHRNGMDGWRSGLALTRTSFKYYTRNAFEENELVAYSEIEDYGLKLHVEKDSVWKDMGIKAGLEWIRHGVKPSVINSAGFFSEVIGSGATTEKTVQEMAAFIQQEWHPVPRLLVSAGFRGSLGLLRNTIYGIPEPRIALRYAVRENQSLKLSYSRMSQYIHRVSNSAISTPTDIWYPVTDRIEPQSAHQIAVAWQKFLGKQKIFFSAEGYYKSMSNLMGYQEGTNLFFNTEFESKLIQGRGRSYGMEFLLRKEAGKLTGWLSYTLSWSWRQYDQINKGEWFPARYDRRHNGAVVMQYKFHDRWAASMVWEFISGSRFTPIIGQYVVLAPTLTGVDLIPVYSGVNEVKLSDTHRLDLGLQFKSKPGRRVGWHIFAGVNNVYNRASPIGIFIEQDETSGALRYSQPGLFGLLPFVSFGFSF